MADLFDMNVAGIGWHIPVGLVALAALFIACFAITGYISFRPGTVHPEHLLQGASADHDFDEVSARKLDVSEELKVKEGSPYPKHVYPQATNGSFAVEFGGRGGNTVALQAIPLSALVPHYHYTGMQTRLANMMGSGSTLTVAQTTDLFGLTAVASAAIAAGTTGFAGPGGDLVAQVYSGTVTADVASAAGTNCATVGQQRLIVFNDVALTAAIDITITLNAGSELRAAGNRIFCNVTAGNEDWVDNCSATEPTTADQTLIITAGAADAVILKGSYLYFSCTSTAVDTTVVHGCLRTNTGVVTVTFGA